MKLLIYSNPHPYLKYISRIRPHAVAFDNTKSVYDNFYKHCPTHILLEYSQLCRATIKCIEKYQIKLAGIFDLPEDKGGGTYVGLQYADYIGVDDELFYKTQPSLAHHSEFLYNGSSKTALEPYDKAKLFGTGNESDPRYCGIMNENIKRILYASADSIFVDTIEEFYIARSCHLDESVVGAATLREPQEKILTHREIAENICVSLGY